jgi:hypothetical protein
MGERQIWYREDVSLEEWEAHAVECEQKAREIEQDKHRILQDDGYAFYHDKMMSNKFAEAHLARNHGVDSVLGLVDLDGNLVDAKMVDGKYGRVWCVQVGEGQVAWVNVSGANSVEKRQAFYRGKGYQIADVYYHFGNGQYGFYADKSRGVVEIVIH